MKAVKDPPAAPPPSSYKHMKTWLTEASEKEFDTLARWLLQRRKTSLTTLTESKDAADGLPPESQMRRAPYEESRPAGPLQAKTGPKVRRNISIQDITAMQEALFPDKRDESVHRRWKLADR